jgi:DNA-binding CsgD family transcriptional regulator
MANYWRAAQEEQPVIDALLGKLTVRERQVLALVVIGHLNKQIAHKLGITEKTVKVHRGRFMAKLGMRNIVEVVQFAVWAGLLPIACPVPLDALDHSPIARYGASFLDFERSHPGYRTVTSF